MILLRILPNILQIVKKDDLRTCFSVESCKGEHSHSSVLWCCEFQISLQNDAYCGKGGTDQYISALNVFAIRHYRIPSELSSRTVTHWPTTTYINGRPPVLIFFAPSFSTVLFMVIFPFPRRSLLLAFSSRLERMMKGLD